MKARKKPVEVEVMQYKGDNKQELYEWSNGVVHLAYESSDTYILVVDTLEGTMVVPKNSFIIKGVEGEFYACDYDIFHKTYELIIEKDWLPGDDIEAYGEWFTLVVEESSYYAEKNQYLAYRLLDENYSLSERMTLEDVKKNYTNASLEKRLKGY